VLSSLILIVVGFAIAISSINTGSWEIPRDSFAKVAAD